MRYVTYQKATTDAGVASLQERILALLAHYPAVALRLRLAWVSVLEPAAKGRGAVRPVAGDVPALGAGSPALPG